MDEGEGRRRPRSPLCRRVLEQCGTGRGRAGRLRSSEERTERQERTRENGHNGEREGKKRERSQGDEMKRRGGEGRRGRGQRRWGRRWSEVSQLPDFVEQQRRT